MIGGVKETRLNHEEEDETPCKVEIKEPSINGKTD